MTSAEPKPFRQYGFGQPIDSAIAIPGAIAVPEAASAAEPLSITAATGPAPAPGDLYRIDGDAFVYSLSGIARFRCTRRSIALTTPTEADAALVAELLVANALPAVLWQQGSFVLHASAVVLPGWEGAIAIAGASGLGKSSVAKALLDQGAKLVGDDSVRIDCGPAGTTVSGLAGGLFEALEPGTKRRFTPVAPEVQVSSARLLGIAVLGERTATLQLDLVNRLRAVELVLAQQHRPGIPALLGSRQNVVAQAAAIAESVPVAIWHRRVGEMAITTGEAAALQRYFAASR